MFERYDMLSRYFDAGTLAHEWPDFVEREFTKRWDRQTVSGHVHHADFQRAFPVLAQALQHPGLYVWGAGLGSDVRVQYVGIATNLYKRFTRRYIAELTGGNARSATSREIGIASLHEKTLLRLPDDFRVHGRRDVAKYTAAGIVVHRSRNSRLQRAERYAKVGLPNLWYALMPAPPGTKKRRLEDIETVLINISNAKLYRAFANGDVQSRPLLNLKKVEKVNPWLSASEQSGYSAWLNGSWHRASHSFALQTPESELSDRPFARAKSIGIEIFHPEAPHTRSRRANANRKQRAPAHERFPLKKFYPFARANQLGRAADEIEGMPFPRTFKRGSTVRRGKAISVLERAGRLDVFIKAQWPYGQMPRGLAELKSCLALARRWNGDELR